MTRHHNCEYDADQARPLLNPTPTTPSPGLSSPAANLKLFSDSEPEPASARPVGVPPGRIPQYDAAIAAAANMKVVPKTACRGLGGRRLGSAALWQNDMKCCENVAVWFYLVQALSDSS